jgi:uncharacterized caspase-like protein
MPARPIMRILLAAIAVAATLTHASAKQIAVVIGNDAYAEIPPLNAGVADARAMKDGLTRAGFSVEIVENGSKRQISRALTTVEGRIEPGDTVVFHYSGHGFEIDGQNWLLPVDVPAAREGEAGLIKDAAFNAADIIDRFRARGAGTVVAILDACRNNPFLRPGTRALAGSRGLAGMEAGGGVFIMFSAGSKQEALDRLSPTDKAGTSVFVRSFLPLIERPELSLIDIAKETQGKVRDLARSVGHEQVPAYYDGIVGRVSLTGALPSARIEIKPPEPASPPQARNAAAEDVFWQSIRDSTQPAMFEAYLAQVRSNAFSGIYRTLAELKLASLKDGQGRPQQPATAPPAPPPAPGGRSERALIAPAPITDTAEVTACDSRAADPRDPDRPTGVAGTTLDASGAADAVSACARAAAQPDAPRRITYQLARAQEANGNRADAVGLIEKAADLGHPLALFTLAERTLAGEGRTRDAARAMALFYRAADAGVTVAIVRIGQIYASGQGAGRDHAKAIAFYNLALKLGEPSVYPELGQAYLAGRGVIRDTRKACDLFRQGTAAGNADAARLEAASCGAR